MSRNLLKQIYTVVQPEEKRVIDTNSLVQQRLEELEERKRAVNGGFTAGLAAEQVDILPQEGEEGAEESAENVIKAKESSGRILEDARNEAESIIAEAKAQAMRICDDAKNQAEVEKNRIIADAKQQGYSEGLALAKEEEQTIKNEYLEKESRLETFYQKQIDELEPQLVLAHLLSSTLTKIDGSHDFMVHVSKDDYPYVSMQKKQILTGAVSANCNVEIVEDLTLSKNECLIEAESGIFDCGLGTQLSELRQKLMLLSWSRED